MMTLTSICCKGQIQHYGFTTGHDQETTMMGGIIAERSYNAHLPALNVATQHRGFLPLLDPPSTMIWLKIRAYK